jgi:hypothetical protein
MIARFEPIIAADTCDRPGSEGLSVPRTDAAFAENPGDFCLCVVIQQAIDFGHHFGRGHFCLPGVERSWRRQRFCDPALESNVGRDLLVLDKSHVFEQKPHQPLSLAVRRLRILP